MVFVLAALLLAMLVLGVLLAQQLLNVRRYVVVRASASSWRLQDAPTVSVCVPARNETHALEDCLVDVVGSDYEKLEIIVLDDCSQDKTSEIIRSFAHDGVRFVRGEAPDEGWLGKNNAYNTLAQEARGDYLVFVSVDTRLESTTISTLVEYMQEKKLSMVSVLPERRDIWRASVLLAPLRYFWQLVLPLGLNTPTATALWIIRRGSLESLGGFASFKDNIMLENVLAKKFFAQSEYRFLVAGGGLNVWHAKKWRSQADTAVRLWYPSLHKNLFYCLLAALAHAWLFILPLVGLGLGVAEKSGWLTVVALIVVALELGLFFVYVHTTRRGVAAIFGVILLPIVALQEIILIAASAIQYKRGRVSWKGRNICYPVLRYPRHF